MYSDYNKEHFSTLFICALILGVLLYIAFLGLLQRTLNCVAKERRTISPWSIWALLIPVVNLIFQFLVVREIARSLRAEFNYRKSNIKEDRPGYDLGLLMCFANVLTPFCVYENSIGIIALIFWSAYWVKIAGFRRKLGGPRIQFDEWEKKNASQTENAKGNLEDFREKLE